MLTLTRQTVPDWRSLVWLTDEELAGYDLAAVNLACAEGLPGADEIDADYCFFTLDAWADATKRYTAKLMPQFRRRPREYENSEAYFRTLTLITVLQRDMGVRYNPAKIPEDAPFDTADSFIHGVIQGDGGTCATMPVIYAAVGRRLGYPIRLASSRGKVFTHLFARWDDPATGERFNIEATNKGLSTPADDYYRTDPHHPEYTITPQDEADGCYLRTKTPRSELANFLGNRAWRWEDMKDWWRCVDSWAWAASLVPDDRHAQNSLKRCMIEWDKVQRAKKPEGFPGVLVRAECRQFPDSLPVELEQDICGLTAVHHMLTDPRLDEKYWRRMRQGNCPRTPTIAVADFAPNTSCRITLKFD